MVTQHKSLQQALDAGATCVVFGVEDTGQLVADVCDATGVSLLQIEVKTLADASKLLQRVFQLTREKRREKHEETEACE